MIQLVKYKEYRRVSTVYISLYYVIEMGSVYGKHEVC